MFQSAMVAAKKYKILLISHRMTWLSHINIFTSWEILLLGYCDILMRLKMSISIYDQFVSELDIPTSITFGLMYHFKCTNLFCTFQSSLHFQSFQSSLHFQRLLSEFYWHPWNPYQQFLELLPRLGFFCLLSFHQHFYFSVNFFCVLRCVWCLLYSYSRQLICQISLSNGFS